MIFQEGDISILNKNFLYLHTCTNKDQIDKASFLQDVHKTDKPLTLCTNIGSSRTNKQSHLGTAIFWLDEGRIANLVSLRTLESHFKVKDSEKEGGAFICFTANKDIVFKRCKRMGFLYADLQADGNNACMTLVQCI